MHIKSLIFDLGGVIINLDPALTWKAFHGLGLDPAESLQTLSFFNEFEKGLISEASFRTSLRPYLKEGVTDAEIDIAWNAMLLDIPLHRITILRQLRARFRIFLLSNTNSIHKSAFVSYFEATHNTSWPDLFDRIFYSHEMGMRKPDPEIYLKVLHETGFKPQECLFIDDNLENISAASSLGLHTIHAHQPLDGTMLEEINKITQPF
jgi:putative hydrolase of the HAD superfamily